MIVLDTNVLSEILRPEPSAVVLRWLNSLMPASAYTTAVTQAEILYGVRALPVGKRRSRLAEEVNSVFAEDFRGRVLPFDSAAALHFAIVFVSRQSVGRPISQFDAMIAAIALSNNASIATRNTRDFEDCGVHLINPWIEQR